MAIERTDTTGFQLFPIGHYKFQVSAVPLKKKGSGGGIYYEFNFETPIDGNLKKYTERFMVWKAGELLKALGGVEVMPNVFEWDKEATLGKFVEADIIHEPDQKEPTKKWPRMQNITEGVPF